MVSVRSALALAVAFLASTSSARPHGLLEELLGDVTAGAPHSHPQDGPSWDALMKIANVQPSLEGMLPAKTGPCVEKLQRRAWSDLSKSEKKEYIDAELCLMKMPQKTNLGGKTRYDDLVKTHQLQAFLVHGDGLFLPFHRLQMHAHERALREECGYTGAQPYWDEESEAGHFSTSEIFDEVYGFGGDGTGANGCIETGPFKDYMLSTGLGYLNYDHCIIRTINDRESRLADKKYVDACLALPTFAEAWPCMERNPHNGGHRAVGGEMTNPISSPGDPLFYLHHTFLDRVWWRWQALDKENRIKDIAGYTSNPEPPTGFVDATLDTVLNMYGVIPNATVADVMDIGGDLLCHEYVDPQGKGGKSKGRGKKEENEGKKDEKQEKGEKDEETDDEDEE
ncbi:hypothetical protein BZA77DRAFT_257581 [Pyronema omphalodes]|nr:hypothetical protein BZA77DRAFT_257581 [Pyronema omphalodes]